LTAIAAAVSLAPASTEAQVIIDLSADQRIIEGNSGTAAVVFNVNLNTTWIAPVTVNWRTIAGSATGPGDFVVVSSGTVTVNPGSLSAPVTAPDVEVRGDTTAEWSQTLQQDEVFFVELFNPVNGTIRRGRASVTIVDNDYAQPGVQFLSVVSDSTAAGSSGGRNRLQWRVPAAPTAPSQITVAWNSGAPGTGCSSPIADTAGEPPGPKTLAPGAADSRQSWLHDASDGNLSVPRDYCYTVFIYYGAVSPERAEVKTTSLDSFDGPIKWTFTPGHYNGVAAPSVEPPTVGADAVYAVSTDGVVHAMTRNVGGGVWPPLWNPVALGKPAHNRSAVTPLPVVGNRLFVGTENGELFGVDARTGAIAWARIGSNGTQLMTNSLGVQATPALLLKQFGGQNDLVLVGTANGPANTKFFALDPVTGANVDEYPGGGDTPPGPISNVFGMAVVDYSLPNRVYFGTAGAAFTLWSLDLGPLGAPNLTLSSMPWNPKPLGVTGGTVGSAVLRNGVLYLGTDTGATAAVQALRISDGVLRSPYVHGDGQVKGFTWPDRRDGRLYFSTTGNVHAIRDDGSAITSFWGSPLPISNPSIVLQKPGTDDLYVGDGNGRLVKINANTKATTALTLATPGVVIGAPSLDNVHNLLHVGSDRGVIYAIGPF
jgi:hypothetical protein